MVNARQKEERKRTKAIIKIQKAYRCYLARMKVRDAFRATYRKVKNEYDGTFFYRNVVTQEIITERPRFLRSYDIPESRPFESPDNYNPGTELTPDGFALIVTCTTFPLGKWVEIDKAAEADHDLISFVAGHDYICRIRDENVFALKNPSTNEFKDALDTIKKSCRTSGFLFVYLSTHVITINGGEKENKNERNYFAFKNSFWGSAAETAETCVSFSEFSGYLNKIACKEKTVALNFAFHPKPAATLFTSPKILYPSSSCISSLATAAKSAVIACCTIGNHISEVIKLCPSGLVQNVVVNDPTAKLPKAGNRTVDRETANALEKATKIQADLHANRRVTMMFRTKQVRTNATSAFSRDNAERNRFVNQLIEDWKLPKQVEITKTPRPVLPSAAWRQSEETSFEIKIDMPSQQEVRRSILVSIIALQRTNFNRRLMLWRAKRTVAKPWNLLKRGVQWYQRKNICAPCQTSAILPEGYTLFGRAVYFALKGGASRPDSPFVTVRDVFQFVREFMVREIHRYSNVVEMTTVTEIVDGETIAKEVPKPGMQIEQSPLIMLPGGHADYLDNRVCYRCSPPAAPERPYIVRVGDHEVLLEWYDQPFDGVASSKYKLFMRNMTRNFNHWEEIYVPSDLIKTQFLVRNLPMGIQCQFKLKACNSGGWSQFSDETVYVTPGEDRRVITDAIRWKRMQLGGYLSVLDRIGQYPKHRDELLHDLRLLLAFIQNYHGCSDSSMAMKVSLKLLEVLKTFVKDADVSSYIFLILGWCIRGKWERRVRQAYIQCDLTNLVGTCVNHFRTNSRVVNSVQWLQYSLHKYLPKLIDNQYYVLNPALHDTTKEKFNTPVDEDDNHDEELDKMSLTMQTS